MGTVSSRYITLARLQAIVVELMRSRRHCAYSYSFGQYGYTSMNIIMTTSGTRIAASVVYITTSVIIIAPQLYVVGTPNADMCRVDGFGVCDVASEFC